MDDPGPSGEKAGLNFYEFVKNDPVNRVDPVGLDACNAGGVNLDIDRTPMCTPDNPTDEEAYQGGYSYCAPDKDIWDRISDWLNSLAVPKELGPDRVTSTQNRKLAGFACYDSCPSGITVSE